MKMKCFHYPQSFTLILDLKFNFQCYQKDLAKLFTYDICSFNLLKTQAGENDTDWLLLSLWVSQVIFWHYNIIIKMILLHICTLVFLFQARFRFPSSKSIPKVIKDRYGKSVLKLARKFEKTDLRCRRAELDLSFLKYCFENSLIPKYLRFKVSNRSLKSSDTYRQCQIRLLKEEISNKKSIIRQRQSELVLLKNRLKASMNVIDYAHIGSIFLISNDKILTKQKDI